MMGFEGIKRIHLIGIGGSSMNGLAQMLLSQGYEVQGSDRGESQFTKRLKELGIDVKIGHNADNIENADMVIYSAAIKPDNVERVAALGKGILQLERSVALGMLSSDYDEVVGIAGCHGKTTITSMLALISRMHHEKDPEHTTDATIHVGGYVDFLSGGVHVGGHELFITEACEYVESFLTLHPTIALISNIDNDHLDYYGDMEHIVLAFKKYAALLSKDGLIIGCVDDHRVMDILSESPCEKLTYGHKNADYVPDNIAVDELGNTAFDLVFRGKTLGRIELSVPGEHNMLNSIAAASVALALCIPFCVIKEALNKYTLTRRRFELMGEKNGAKIYHDYAHHPSEIASTLQAAASIKHNRIIAVFQCNSYTRAKTLFIGDMTCMEKADLVLVPDIYPGREVDTGIVHARDMVEAINRSCGEGRALYIPTFEAINHHLDRYAKPGDIIITLGSGDVYENTKKLI
ncbi:MAG: UDP-N-acetylmuramate--L-alanine ligase [Clostridia bacterium]|nr:UDP-N-acetylmuramate--L-alanine ligase [Clostridia bacterium]